MATHLPGGDRPDRPADDDDRHAESELKTALRTRFRALRRALSPAVRAAQSAAVGRAVARFLAARSDTDAPLALALYRAVRSELDPDGVLEPLRDALSPRAVHALYPRVDGATLDFAPAHDGWQPGPFGLLEPTAAAVDPDGIDWVLLPALAVDARGIRLGYGGGFYDRFLAAHPALVARSIALVFDAQLAPDALLPREPFDVAVAWVATPDGVSPTRLRPTPSSPGSA